MNKCEIRKWIKTQKFSLTDSERINEANAVFAKIERMAEFQSAERVMLYHSLPDELPTHEFITKWAHSKHLFLPRVNGDELEVLPYNPHELQSGAFSIEEPQGNNITHPNTLDLIIVPAVALDHDKNRLGRGKGYYDRLLSKTQATTIGVGYDLQLIPTGIPAEPHDIKLDYIITKSHFIA